MSHSVCRICLIGNTKTVSIKNTQLQVIYERLVGFMLITDNGRPNTVCYICHAQLQRCYRFLDKCQKTGDILTELFLNNIDITPNMVAVLNKEMQNNFCTTPVESVSFSCLQTDVSTAVKEELIDVKTEIKSVKEETEVLSPNVSCKVCLACDVKSFSININPLQEIFEKLTNTKVSTGDVICYICHPQLRRCWKLMIKSRKTEKILAELLHNGVQLTQSVVSMLNVKTEPIYSSTPVKYESYYEIDEEIVEIVVKEELLEVDYKYTVEVEDDKTKDTCALNEISVVKMDPDQDTKSTKALINSNIQDDKLVHVVLNEQCDVCDFKCKSLNGMKNHLRLHDPKRRFSCETCSYRFSRSRNLRLHVKYVHSKNYPCGKCDEAFPRKSHLKMHMRAHSAENIFPCEKCSKIFNDSKNLRSHYSFVHPGERYHCERCQFTSPSLKCLHDHIVRVHAESRRYICDKCHKTLAGKSSLKKHLKLCQTAIKQHECKICLKSFSTPQLLRVHNTCHAIEKPFTCDICNLSYRERTGLKIHSLKHTAVKPFACSVCGAEFYRKDVLNKHMVIHTGEKIYACGICDLTFVSNAYAKKHMATHSKVKPYTCDLCQGKFKSRASLRIHMIVHYGKDTYICDKCNRSFTRKQYLIGHIRYHSGLRPFACTRCDKYFYSKQSLELHTRTHTGEKPYPCNRCDKRFSQRGSLNLHIAVHKGSRPYACPACSKRFAQKSTLQRHKTSFHSMNTDLKTYICDICNKVFIEKEKLVHHIRFHNLTTPYRCDTCLRSFSKLCSLTQHVRIHTEKKLLCVFCNEIFETNRILVRHNTTVHGAAKKFACNFCEKPFDMLIRLNSHIRLHTGEKQFSCEFCEKTYVERRDLLHHLRVIHNKRCCFD